MIAFMNEGFHKVLRDDTRAAVIIDRDGIIQQINPQFVTQFGYGTPEVVGQHVNMLLPEDRRDGHKDHIATWFMHPRARPMGEALNIQGRNKNGELMDLDIQLSYVETDMGIMALGRITPR
jgi:PAS domain S-box-containing protein